jgi:hypothetical protein
MPPQSPYEYYLELLGQWPTGIALASQWMITIYFDGVRNLVNDLQNKLRSREASLWSYNQNVLNLLIDGAYQQRSDNMMGCVFARQVSLPSESIEASNQGLEYGGFLAPATANNRAKYEPLSVTMLETNASFLDLIIRPWIIMVGYNGLIARQTDSPKNVKTTIDIVFYAKTGYGNPMGIRKVYRFYNAAPISINGEQYSYMEEGMRYTDVKFVYDKYSVLDGNTSNFITLR